MTKVAQNVVVYVRADDVRLLLRQGKEPSEWVRGLVRHALDRLAEKEKEGE
jgi:hypothetical protein